MNNKDYRFLCLCIFFFFNLKKQARQTLILSCKGFLMAGRQPADHYSWIACEAVRMLRGGAVKMLRDETVILLKYLKKNNANFLFPGLGNRLPFWRLPQFFSKKTTISFPCGEG